LRIVKRLHHKTEIVSYMSCHLI